MELQLPLFDGWRTDVDSWEVVSTTLPEGTWAQITTWGITEEQTDRTGIEIEGECEGPQVILARKPDGKFNLYYISEKLTLHEAERPEPSMYLNGYHLDPESGAISLSSNGETLVLQIADWGYLEAVRGLWTREQYFYHYSQFLLARLEEKSLLGERLAHQLRGFLNARDPASPLIAVREEYKAAGYGQQIVNFMRGILASLTGNNSEEGILLTSQELIEAKRNRSR